MLAVPRRYGRTDYLPVIAWGQLAVQSGRLQVGDSLSLEGRIQSRTYQKQTDTGTEQRTAYEVSMMQLLDDEQEEEIFSFL
jgi:single-stranded DNA-binding protein